MSKSSNEISQVSTNPKRALLQYFDTWLEKYIIIKIVQSITKSCICKFGNLKLNKWIDSGNDVARVLARATQQDFYRKSVIFIWCQHQKLGIIKLIWKTQPANHMYNVCTMLHSILVCTLHISVGHYTDIWLGVYYVSIIKNFTFLFQLTSGWLKQVVWFNFVLEYWIELIFKI